MPTSDLGKLRTRLLSILYQEGTPAARRRAHGLFRAWTAAGLATPNHFAQMMKWLTSSEDMRRCLEEEMPSAGVMPDGVCFTMLVDQLVLEGDVAGARDLVHRTMPERHGITRRDQKTTRALEGRSEGVLSRQRIVFLKKRLRTAGAVPRQHPQQGHRQRQHNQGRNNNSDGGAHMSLAERERQRATALRFFNAMVKNGVAEPQHFNLALMQYGENGVATSDDMINVMLWQDMPRARVEPNASTYAILAMRFMLEGDKVGALDVVERMMPAAGLEKRRRGSDGDGGGRAGSGDDNAGGGGEGGGDHPPPYSFVGLPPNLLADTLGKSENELDRMRLAFLNGWAERWKFLKSPLWAGADRGEDWEDLTAAGYAPDPDTPRIMAENFFWKLQEHGAAKIAHFRSMTRFRESSEEMLGMLEVEMPRARVAPDLKIFHELLVRLVREENFDVAQSVIEEDMPRARVSPTKATWRILRDGEMAAAKRML